VPRQHWSCALAIISTAVPEVPAARQDRQTRRQGTDSTTWYVRIAPVSSHGLKSSYTATVVLWHASAALLTGVVHVQSTSSCAGPGTSCGIVKGKGCQVTHPYTPPDPPGAVPGQACSLEATQTLTIGYCTGKEAHAVVQALHRQHTKCKEPQLQRMHSNWAAQWLCLRYQTLGCQSAGSLFCAVGWPGHPLCVESVQSSGSAPCNPVPTGMPPPPRPPLLRPFPPPAPPLPPASAPLLLLLL
jgi:hypothetical protein